MIEVEHLSKRYGPTLAVDDLSFVAPPGTVTGFLGPNGAGKSTTMRMIAGLDAHRRRRVVNAGIVSLCGGSILSGNTASNPRRTSNFSGSSPVACPSPTPAGVERRGHVHDLPARPPRPAALPAGHRPGRARPTR